jgi:hypothetical protein
LKLFRQTVVKELAHVEYFLTGLALVGNNCAVGVFVHMSGVKKAAFPVGGHALATGLEDNEATEFAFLSCFFNSLVHRLLRRVKDQGEELLVLVLDL